MWHLTACKISVLEMKWFFFYHISELKLATLIQRYDKKIISYLFQFRNERLTEILQAVRCHMLWSYWYYISLYLDKKCLLSVWLKWGRVFFEKTLQLKWCRVSQNVWLFALFFFLLFVFFYYYIPPQEVVYYGPCWPFECPHVCLSCLINMSICNLVSLP